MLKRFLRLLFPNPKEQGESEDQGPTYGLELLFDNGQMWKNPNEAEIEKAVKYIEQAPETWITLSRGMADFITVITNEQGGFTVEYEVGGRDYHQRVDGPPLSTEQVLEILVPYSLERDCRFYENWDWQRVPISEIDLRQAPRMAHGDIFNDPH